MVLPVCQSKLCSQKLFAAFAVSVPRRGLRVYCLQSQAALGVSPPPPSKKRGKVEEGQIQVQFYLECSDMLSGLVSQ